MNPSEMLRREELPCGCRKTYFSDGSVGTWYRCEEHTAKFDTFRNSIAIALAEAEE